MNNLLNKLKTKDDYLNFVKIWCNIMPIVVFSMWILDGCVFYFLNRFFFITFMSNYILMFLIVSLGFYLHNRKLKKEVKSK